MGRRPRGPRRREARVNEHEALVERISSSAGTVMLIGGLDSGKSTLARALLGAALGSGRRSAYLDADLGQKCVGPPGTIGLRLLMSADDLGRGRLIRADALSFVGATSPQGHLLPVV